MNAKIMTMALALLLAAPAVAGWKVVAPTRVTVAQSTLSVTPDAGWNRWTVKPIRNEERWSLDGPLLNRLSFYGGIAQDEPLARERNRKREPLPKFDRTMRATDIAELIERTVRITEEAPDFVTEAVEPATFAGQPGFRLRYRYTAGELVRRGEARGRIADGRLYMIVFTAPALHYFDAGLPRAAAIMDSARIG
ncbi:hypothetical protein [Sphingomonas endophytica]|uniref:Uncharacterized protein n=1 Tax=Sphingomonas endophytica TaxID=869719 RepID=A0A147I8J5_9SPHN|nr:hypothetical protein [Sphingomonas endophytica]KTT75371.1 hypothetical protein NS334_02905 [Sphingomonas endophytica]